MCGIAGIFSFDHKTERVRIERMCDALSHRGPDDSGIHISPDSKVLLGHRRLSIIDLSSSARQPLSNEDDTIWISYNGEIYNYQELRKELDVRGHRFKSQSDTEVIIHGYEEWGIEGLLERLRGMFSFCLYDSGPSPSILLVRDRFGIKPVYYAIQDQRFIFASEIKAIIESGLVSKEIDLQSVALYLLYGCIPPPRTIYKGITSLEPGHYLVLSRMGLVKKHYYQLEGAFRDTSLYKLSKQEAVWRVRSCLMDTIRHHLVSDVEVGVFLSGGVDSTSMVALMREVGCKNRIKTVSAIFPDTPYDESRYARLAAQRFGTEHFETEVNGKGILSHSDRMFGAMDQPTVDGVNTYFISLAASEAGLKVAMAGHGGDEIFGGYTTFKYLPRVYYLLKAMQPIPYASPLARFFLDKIGTHRSLKLSAMLNRNGELPVLYQEARTLFHKSEIGKLLRPDIAREALEDLNPPLNFDGADITDKTNQVSFLETTFYLAHQLLRDTDIFSMTHSLEVRVPFVDHTLVELLARIPPGYKYKGTPKVMLLEALNNMLPPEVVNRPKMGFTFPFDLWMRNDLKRFVEERLKSSALFSKPAMEVLLDGFYNGKDHWSKVWSCLVLTCWLDRNGCIL